MTTDAAAKLYLAQHEVEMGGRGFEVYNPNDLPLNELPTIFGFNNGGPAGLLSAVAIAEDGQCLGGHGCSDEGYMPNDLGMLVGTRKDRHENQYQKHYPDGYKMEFVPSDKLKQHVKLNAAFVLNKTLQEENKE